MFENSIKKFFCSSVVILILLQNAPAESSPVKELCPCLPRSICPRTYGTSPYDEIYLKTILTCEKPEEARCCGVAVEELVGTKSVDTNELEPTDTDAAETTTIFTPSDTEVSTIIPEDLDQKIELIDQTQPRIPSYDTIASDDSNESEESKESESSSVENIFQIYPSKDSEESIPSYSKMVNKSPAMLVFASADKSSNLDKNEESSGISSTDEIVEPKLEEIIKKSMESKTIEEAKEVASTENKLELSVLDVNVEEKKVEDASVAQKPILPKDSQVSNDMNEASGGSELKMDDSVVEGTTLNIEADIPDLIATVQQAEDHGELNINKRSNSNYDITTLEPTDSLPSSSESELQAAPKVFSDTPNHKIVHGKLDVVGKSDGIIETVLDNEHKSQIIEVQSILAAMKTEKPTAIKAKSLQELISNDKKQFRPSLGRRRNEFLKTSTQHAVTTEQIETTTQSEAPKRKYSRRLPARKFGESSTASPKTKVKTSTIATTTLPNEVEKMSSRSRYSRRRLPVKSFAKSESTTPLAVETETVTKSSKPLRTVTTRSSRPLQTVTKSKKPLETSDIDPQVMLAKRKQLFASRRNSGWAKLNKSSTTTTTENAVASSSTTEIITEKPILNRFNFKRPPHRLNLKSIESN